MARGQHNLDDQHPVLESKNDINSDDGLVVDQGLWLGYRLLALIGALSFILIGISNVVMPLLEPTPPTNPYGKRQGHLVRSIHSTIAS
jgi:hypothetical protein